jgi:hypothetical protein
LNYGSTFTPEVEGELQFVRHQSNFSFGGVIGISFQFGRTSTRLPSHLPHLEL